MKGIKKKVFNEIEIMPENYEILNCPNCYGKHKRPNQNHFVLCGNTKRKELYWLCVTCGKIFEVKLEKKEQDK